MEYVCLYCFNSSQNAGNCNVCARPRQPVREWATYKSAHPLISLENFNPSTRHVSFDCHLCQSQHEIYIVVKCKIAYKDFQGTPDGAGGYAFPPLAWTLPKKTAFTKYLKASVGLWDGKQLFEHNSVQYTPYFFIDLVTGSTPFHVEITVEANNDVISPMQNSTENRLWTAAVSLLPPYPAVRPPAGKGKHFTQYPVKLYTKSVAARMCLKDNALADNHAEQAHYNPLAHEYGHMIGLPDEYNAYTPPVTPQTQPAAYGEKAVDARPTVYWAQLMGDYHIPIPAWGNYGQGSPKITEHSLMRDVHALPAGFKKRHYLTVMEALNYMAFKTQSLISQGVWSFV